MGENNPVLEGTMEQLIRSGRYVSNRPAETGDEDRCMPDATQRRHWQSGRPQQSHMEVDQNGTGPIISHRRS
jgi:hypothetical protein